MSASGSFLSAGPQLAAVPGMTDVEVQHTINSVYKVFKGCGVASDELVTIFG